MSGSYRSYRSRLDVLLRCAFRCTFEGCEELACDIHHVIPQKYSGTDKFTNLLGLCSKHQQWVHKDEFGLIDVPDTSEKITRLELAKRLLLKQLSEPKIPRLSELHRAELFQEIEKSTSSPENFWQQKHPIYNRNYWTSYEVFLKGAWSYLCDNSKERSLTGAMVLYKKLWLYRRRRGQVRTASKIAKNLTDLLHSLPERDSSLIVGKVVYEIAYIKFMQNPLDIQVVEMFNESARLEKIAGNRSGELVKLMHLMQD